MTLFALLRGVVFLKAVSETVKIALARFFGGFGLTAFLALVFPFGATLLVALCSIFLEFL
jgi:hypothetical protein